MKNFFLIIILFIFVAAAASENAGSRGSYTRGGWAGAKYAASGMTGEVMADDVFSIYWNPAGLSELRLKKKLDESQVTEKAKEGKVDEITEEDLLNFSENGNEKLFLNIGASFTKLDIERNAGFAGVAFNFFKGVLGAGLYSIYSQDIETRQSNTPEPTGYQNYSGSVGFLSYAMQWNIMSVGISFKGYYEAIGKSTYSGCGADAGVQVFILPFIKVGVMVRDGVGFLKPYDAPESENRYDFFKPQITTGMAFLTDSGIKISFSGSKKLEQTDFNYGVGVEYAISKYLILDTGLCDNFFSAGFTIKLLNMDVSYAINFDRIDMGYNNTISVAVIF